MTSMFEAVAMGGPAAKPYVNRQRRGIGCKPVIRLANNLKASL